VVGGFVRDLILDKPNDDMDFVIEGNGLDFSQKLAEKLGGELKLHPEFHTAVIQTKWGFHIDVAAARLEFYPEPVSLPGSF
jgi:tRNA nucleotidyltransferase (CCA-adding enzyme)